VHLERRTEASRALLVAAPFVAVAFTLLVSSLLVARVSVSVSAKREPKPPSSSSA